MWLYYVLPEKITDRTGLTPHMECSVCISGALLWNSFLWWLRAQSAGGRIRASCGLGWGRVNHWGFKFAVLPWYQDTVGPTLHECVYTCLESMYFCQCMLVLWTHWCIWMPWNTKSNEHCAHPLSLPVSSAMLLARLTMSWNRCTCSWRILLRKSETGPWLTLWCANSTFVQMSFQTISVGNSTSVETGSQLQTVWLGTIYGGRLWSKEECCSRNIQSSSSTWSDWSSGQPLRGPSKGTSL